MNQTSTRLDTGALQCTRWGRIKLAALSALLAPAAALHAGVTVPAPNPQPIKWTLYSSQPGDCNTQPPASKSVSCGDYGTFYFGPSLPQLDCTDLAGGLEPNPIGYTLPTYEVDGVTFYASEATQVQQALKSIEPAESRAPQGPPPKPCESGSCLSPPGGPSGQDVWMLILDWEMPPLADHGLTMAAIAKQIWHRAVHLAGVDAPPAVAMLGPEIGDGHLIHRLCEFVDQIHAGELAAPTGLSMSLGRHEPSTDGDDELCDPRSDDLTCQLQQVIQQLADEGTVSFAAAGNYTELEIPAALPNVAPVGSLNMAHYQATGESIPTWESPIESELLFPGYGVCIEYLHERERWLYPTPGGASYANVIGASLISRGKLAYELPEPLAESWRPKFLSSSDVGENSDSEGCFVFGDFDDPYCIKVVDRMMKRMLGFPLNTCWSPEISSAVLAVDMPSAPEFNVTKHKPGLSECLANHQPAPTNDLCVPCGMELTKSLGHQPAFAKRLDRPIDGSRDAVLDISAAAELNSSQSPVTLAITDVYLRIENAFYHLLGTENPAELVNLEKAAYETLVIYDAFSYLENGSQPSLVTFFAESGPGGSAQDSCWHSSPLTLMGGQNNSSHFP